MNNNDLISRQTAIDKLFEYAESKFQSGEIELANGILKAKCFLEKQENVPTAYDVDKVTHEINNKIQELDAKQQLFIENGLLNMADKMASKIGIYIECREIVEKAGEEDVSTRNFI